VGVSLVTFCVFFSGCFSFFSLRLLRIACLCGIYLRLGK
jgi:hypothetical protein